MVDITYKNSTLRKAIATAIVKTSSHNTITAVEQRQVPKGDVFEFSRAAGLLAVKKTSDVIPDCHPLPIEYTSITYEIVDLDIIIKVEVHTIYKTGVEVEAMHGASVAALVMYDMLKPIDKGIVIEQVKLLEKKGGKSDLKSNYPNLKVAVVVCSDRVSIGERYDSAGKYIVAALTKYDLECSHYEVIPDDFNRIQETVKTLVAQHFDLILFTGGTGLSARDVTPDALAPLIDRNIPGIMERARQYGQVRTPYAMLSRGVGGFIQNSLVLTFPGSQNAVTEYMSALFPQILHVFDVKIGDPHKSA
jgi:cyclic pyranopterin phosphate synthase